MDAAVDLKIAIPGYHLVEQLHCGSKTVVYRAVREADQQAVVLKLLVRECRTSRELLQFRNQYAIAKSLKIPGIIHFYSLQPYHNKYALVMEDFGGIFLRQHAQKQPEAVQKLNFKPLESLTTINPSTIDQSSPTSSKSSNSISDSLDFASVLKAAQVLSSTIQLDELINRLSKIILENSGAETCVLLLPESDEWQISAIASFNPQDNTVIAHQQVQPLAESTVVPTKLIHYVKDTLDSVLIEDGKTNISGIIGEYFLQHQPKSVLCIPIINHNHLVAIVYLENGSTKGVFTRDRVEILNLLCTHAAISLANARLYQQSQTYAQQLEQSLEKLRLSKVRFQKLADNVPAMIYQLCTTPDGSAFMSYVSSGCYNLYELTPEEIMAGTQNSGFMEHPDDVAGIKQVMMHSIQNRTPFVHEWRIITPSGIVKWVQAASRPELQADGSMLWDGFIIDVSDRKFAEAALLESEAELRQKSQQLEQTLKELQTMQLQLVQNEKMSALGNLVAGVAHEINNPVGFIAGNLQPAKDYINDLFGLIDLYQEKLPNPDDDIADEIAAIDLEYVREDLPKLIDSMKLGIERIGSISTSLRTFSRADQHYKVLFNIHEGIESTILILKHRLKANENHPTIEIFKEYGKLPSIECFPGQLNQVFMNLLANAIDALEESNQGRTFEQIEANPNRITIVTSMLDQDHVRIAIADNGIGMTEEVKQRIFGHLFTTKAVGKGTGLGLAIAHQIIVEKHGGKISVDSVPEQGTKFIITIPVKAKVENPHIPAEAEVFHVAN
ncbi:GAF domain-containing protein [Nostoc sp. CENA67]|uniref:histidine kinase n=1 Tax=Amazonocrinis nigriterrae CENA67 TaxID=2794033 RepID=A0A8J7HTA3_9NOST|nr:ATP-binding protein [Amazonocrinis nigriterrae]MBH8563388.1 GAF domain-containing protein [Amazonocrinis nigriterrae CENA67]